MKLFNFLKKKKSAEVIDLGKLQSVEKIQQEPYSEQPPQEIRLGLAAAKTRDANASTTNTSIVIAKNKQDKPLAEPTNF